MAEAVTFYQCMGFELIVDTPHYARFLCPEGNATFSLSLADKPQQTATNSSTVTPSSSTTIYFEHEQLDTLVAALIEKGIVFEQLPQDMRYLWREAVLFDPSGNKIKLYWAGENRINPPWRVNT